MATKIRKSGEKATIKNNFVGFNDVGVFVKTSMCRYIYKCHKILRTIIISNSIKMMAYFGRLKITSDLLFNYEAMLHKVTYIGKWMRRHINLNISIRAFRSTAAPSRTLFSFLAFLPFRSRMNTFFITSRIRFHNTFCVFIPRSFSKHTSRMFTAIDIKGFSSFRKFFTIFRRQLFTLIPYRFCSYIYSPWHNCLQIKKAAFGGLSETVKFLHLLTAKISDIKNPSLISNLSITLLNDLSIERGC